MALNASTIETAAAAAVQAEFLVQFPNVNPPSSQAAIAAAMSAVIAKVVPAIINAIKTNADLTGVTAGTDTVAGGVD